MNTDWSAVDKAGGTSEIEDQSEGLGFGKVEIDFNQLFSRSYRSPQFLLNPPLSAGLTLQILVEKLGLVAQPKAKKKQISHFLAAQRNHFSRRDEYEAELFKKLHSNSGVVYSKYVASQDMRPPRAGFFGTPSKQNS